MDAIEIQGGRPLKGEVTVSGSKNATLPQIAAALLAPGPSTFHNVPDLADVRTMGRLIAHLGAKVSRGAEVGPHTLRVDASELPRPEAPYDLVRTMRAAVPVVGPVEARLGDARVSLPGGCAIGARPIDQHLKGLAALGAHIELAHGYVVASAKRLRGAQFVFDVPTVTGTENLVMAAALADGRTVLENCAREPEVTALAAVLTRMGARIDGAGTSTVVVEGVRELRPADVEVIPDRIEAGTLLAAALITGGNVLVRRARAEDLEALLVKVREAGGTVSAERDGLRLRAPPRPEAVDFVTGPFPGFPTDLQAQLMACMTVAQGAARVVETVFENRFMHGQELSRMGGEIHVDGHTAGGKGVPQPSGAPGMAPDLPP